MYRKLYRVAIVIFLLAFFNFQQAFSNEAFKKLYDSARHSRSIDMAQLALEKAKKLDNSELISKANQLVAFYNQLQHNYFEAITYYFESLKHYRQIENVKGQIACLQNLGIIYSKARFFRKSLDFYLDALQLGQLTNDPESQGLLLYDIGYIHSSIQEYETAKDYYKQSIDILRQYDRYDIISDVFTELGYIEANLGNDSLSYKYYDSSVMVTPVESDYYYYSVLRNTNSQAYQEIKKGRLQIAENLLVSAINDIHLSDFNRQILSEMYWNLANIYSMTDRENKYINALTKFIQCSNLLDFKDDFHEANKTLSDYYKNKDSNEASKYVEMLYKFGRELRILKDQLEDKHVQYQIEAADYRKQLEQKNQQFAEHKQANLITYLIIAVVALVVYIFVSSYLRKIKSEKAKIKLEKENIYKDAKEVLTKVHTPSV